MEVRTLRLLLIHADKFEYESKEKAVKEPELLPDHAKKGMLQDGLVVFTTVEKGDEQSPENTATSAAASIEEVLGWLKANRGMIYPYAPLSTDLAGREPAIETLKILEGKLAEKGYEVSRAPFGCFQAEDGIRDLTVTGVQTCALPISAQTLDELVKTTAPCIIEDVAIGTVNKAPAYRLIRYMPSCLIASFH